jgi:2'-5' RNA ligase
MGHTVIQTPVPALEPVVRPRVVASLPGALIPETTVCAHITLLGPFVDRHDVDAGLIDKIVGVLTPVRPFTFQLTGVDRFPGDLVYLTPEPADRFQELTDLLAATFPEWPPYGGAFSEVVPHLSIGTALPEHEVEALAERLPVTASVEEVTLTWWSQNTVETMVTFPLSVDRDV